MESNEKPIIDITMSIKVQYLLSITSIYNGVLGAHNWDIISCFIWKESNLVDILPQSNRSVLICLPNIQLCLKFNEFIQGIRFPIYISKLREFISKMIKYPYFPCMNTKRLIHVNMY